MLMKMNNTISMTTSLSQRLTPQQIQYLKLLQLPAIQFEMYVREEIEQNPMLDDPNNPSEIEIFNDDDDDIIPVEATVIEPVSPKLDYEETEGDIIIPNDDYMSNEDTRDPFEEYSDLWEERNGDNDNFLDDYQDEDDRPQMQIRAQSSFEDDLLSQLNLIHLTQEEKNVR